MIPPPEWTNGFVKSQHHLYTTNGTHPQGKSEAAHWLTGVEIGILIAVGK
jgi:hypothetical protein